jgi:hypothetical protein
MHIGLARRTGVAHRTGGRVRRVDPCCGSCPSTHAVGTAMYYVDVRTACRAAGCDCNCGACYFEALRSPHIAGRRSMPTSREGGGVAQPWDSYFPIFSIFYRQLRPPDHVKSGWMDLIRCLPAVVQGAVFFSCGAAWLRPACRTCATSPRCPSAEHGGARQPGEPCDRKARQDKASQRGETNRAVSPRNVLAKRCGWMETVAIRAWATGISVAEVKGGGFFFCGCQVQPNTGWALVMSARG